MLPVVTREQNVRFGDAIVSLCRACSLHSYGTNKGHWHEIHRQSHIFIKGDLTGAFNAVCLYIESWQYSLLELYTQTF